MLFIILGLVLIFISFLIPVAFHWWLFVLAVILVAIGLLDLLRADRL